jgi:hypothetical protein
MGEVFLWLMGCLFGEWAMNADPKSRWLQAIQRFGCLLLVAIFVTMMLAVTGILGRIAGD